MKRLKIAVVVWGAACLCLSTANAALLQYVDLDTVFDWRSPFTKSLDEIKPQLHPLVFSPGYVQRDEKMTTDGRLLECHSAYSTRPEGVFMRFGNGQFTVTDLHIKTVDGVPYDYHFSLSGVGGGSGILPKLEQYFSTVLKTNGKDIPQKRNLLRLWNINGGNLQVVASFGGTIVTMHSTEKAPDRVALGKEPSRSPYEVDLDELTDFSTVWAWTPQILEQKFRVKTEAAQLDPPQFEWQNPEKSRARFSRRLIANWDASLMFFKKSIQAEEAVLEFEKGTLTRMTVSFYNRGDSGPIVRTEFDGRFKLVGKSLNQLLGVVPSNQSAAASVGVKTVSWLWQPPAGLAMLEHNDYSQPGQSPEFLRLKLAAPNQADWSMGKLAVGVQRMALQKNITKTAEGDVFVSGVPMVDQGSKGYCVAASCQRLFEYMQIPCDQHEIAQLVNVDAESGANILGMQKSLAKIDGKYQVAFKPHINPEQYYRGYRTRRVSQRQFALIIKEHADKGIPLLWALELGHPEVPPLPNAGQVTGGHMRLVIGYNTDKGEVIFTDSWGAGHEVKRMKETDAYDATLGLYSMSPRGL